MCEIPADRLNVQSRDVHERGQLVHSISAHTDILLPAWVSIAQNGAFHLKTRGERIKVCLFYDNALRRFPPGTLWSLRYDPVAVDHIKNEVSTGFERTRHRTQYTQVFCVVEIPKGAVQAHNQVKASLEIHLAHIGFDKTHGRILAIRVLQPLFQQGAREVEACDAASGFGELHAMESIATSTT